MNLKKTILIAVSLLSLLPFFADDALKQIDSLIEKREYNQALKLITVYMTENPKNFDQAEKRVQDIFAARARYSKKADDFIRVLLDEPEDDKKKLDMIGELENMERNPGKAERDFVIEAKKAAQFSYFRSQYARMQREARALMAEGKYSEAADVYKNGYAIYQKEFFSNTSNKDIAAKMGDILTAIADDNALYDSAQSDLLSAYEKYIAALKEGDYKKSEKAFSAVDAAFNKVAKIHNAVLNEGKKIQDCYASYIVDFPELEDAAYIAFTERLTNGTEGIADSGMLGVMEEQWSKLVLSMDMAAYSATLKNSEAMTSENATSYDEIKAKSKEVNSFAILSLMTNNLHSSLKTKNGGTFLEANENYSLSFSAMAKWATRCEGLAAVNRSFEEEDIVIDKLSDTSRAMEDERAYKRYTVDKMLDSLEVYKQYRDQFADDAPYLEDLKEEKCGLDWKNALPYHDTLSKAVLERYAVSTVNLWQKLGNYFGVAGSLITGDDEKKNDEALTLLGKTDDDLHYSKESVVKFEETQTQIKADIKVLESEIAILSKDKDYETTISPYKLSLEQNIETLNRLLGECTAHIKTAKNNVVLAQKAKDDAERRYQQALDAVARNDFEAARNSLTRSRTKFNESLFYQEDAELRKRSDELLAQLAQEIAKAENALIVKEVRQLITQARKEYFNGEFETAEGLLIRAKDRWAITNVEEHPEISSMLSLVNNALELKNGRELKVSAPLYPEMSQILNIAKKHFDAGEKQLKKSKKDKALQYFEKALQKLHELQLVYPLNREASVLTLKIAQISDPAEFDKLFALKVDTAKAQIKQKDTRQQAYADLLDLYEINPNYKGLKQLIYDVEIEIGIRQKPVNKSEQQKAANLTAQAKAMIDSAGGDETKLRNALNLLNQANAINADSEATTALIDSVQTKVGGNATLVLSGEDEAKYQKAVQALQKNNVITAKALVEQLLKKNANKNSKKILDLQKRVNALL